MKIASSRKRLRLVYPTMSQEEQRKYSIRFHHAKKDSNTIKAVSKRIKTRMMGDMAGA